MDDDTRKQIILVGAIAGIGGLVYMTWNRIKQIPDMIQDGISDGVDSATPEMPEIPESEDGAGYTSPIDDSDDWLEWVQSENETIFKDLVNWDETTGYLDEFTSYFEDSDLTYEEGKELLKEMDLEEEERLDEIGWTRPDDLLNGDDEEEETDDWRDSSDFEGVTFDEFMEEHEDPEEYLEEADTRLGDIFDLPEDSVTSDLPSIIPEVGDTEDELLDEETRNKYFAFISNLRGQYTQEDGNHYQFRPSNTDLANDDVENLMDTYGIDRYDTFSDWSEVQEKSHDIVGEEEFKALYGVEADENPLVETESDSFITNPLVPTEVVKAWGKMGRDADDTTGRIRVDDVLGSFYDFRTSSGESDYSRDEADDISDHDVDDWL